jgi:hypothetical protein
MTTTLAQGSTPRPYKLAIPQADVDRCLQLAKLTDLKPWLQTCATGYEELEKQQDDYTFANSFGIKPTKLLGLVDRLINGFDWNAWQERMNAMGEHGIVTVTGIEDEPSLDVHYVYRKSDAPNAPTVMLCHGWPGSFFESYKMVEIVSKKYNCIVPSIPGYGPSSAPRSGPTFTLVKAAQAIDAVCRALGADVYIAQGGDWGCAHIFATGSTLTHCFKIPLLNIWSASTPSDAAACITTCAEARRWAPT